MSASSLMYKRNQEGRAAECWRVGTEFERTSAKERQWPRMGCFSVCCRKWFEASGLVRTQVRKATLWGSLLSPSPCWGSADPFCGWVLCQQAQLMLWPPPADTAQLLVRLLLLLCSSGLCWSGPAPKLHSTVTALVVGRPPSQKAAWLQAAAAEEWLFCHLWITRTSWMGKNKKSWHLWRYLC